MTHLQRLQMTGVRRFGTPKRGIYYKQADGTAISQTDVKRIKSLRIPPAWVEVAINPSSAGMVQAVGKDAAGRLQYLYHEKHIAKREKKKFDRLVHFVKALPRMRKALP